MRFFLEKTKIFRKLFCLFVWLFDLFNVGMVIYKVYKIQ